MEITKAMILDGKAFTHKVKVGEHSVTIRSLTEGELSKIYAERSAFFEVKINPKNKKDITTDFDIVKIMKNNTESSIKICILGMSCDGEEWTKEELEQLPGGLVDLIAQEIINITEVDGGDLSRFRQVFGGSSFGPLDTIGPEVGIDVKGNDPGTV